VALEVRMLDVDVCEVCGYPEGSFACKIRCHIFLNTGDAKAAND
jgi:hypothetical protein